MNGQNEVYPYSGILFSHKKRNTDLYYNMAKDKPWKWKKPDTKYYIVYVFISMKYTE